MTPLSVLPNVVTFLEATYEGALVYAAAHRTAPEDPAALAAICLRESLAGAALRPVGPDGAGDWTARAGNWPHRPGVQVIADTPAERERLKVSGWTLPMRRSAAGIWEAIPGPYAIPLDGKGWGRGMWQLDVLGDVRDLIAPAPWPVEKQAGAACAQLAICRTQLVGYSKHPLFERALFSRYNCALSGVVAGLRLGNPDLHTTGGDYGRDVLALRAALRSAYPARLPPPQPFLA